MYQKILESVGVRSVKMLSQKTDETLKAFVTIEPFKKKKIEDAMFPFRVKWMENRNLTIYIVE